MGWTIGKVVDVLQGGEVIREAEIVRVMANGDACIDGGARYQADGVARNPERRASGWRIRARKEST